MQMDKDNFKDFKDLFTPALPERRSMSANLKLKHLPKNLNVGDKVTTFIAFYDGSSEYSKFKVTEKRHSDNPDNHNITYKIDGFQIKITGGTFLLSVLRLPCNGVVYTDTDYLDVQVIRKRKQKVEAD